ncbi:hypothetical protein [Streptomyces sp. GS7]|uniref:hypothetical protein n=1 Tax=Streptomyces sp. GS7 TaxID=2692234 RepID=UPI0013162309|nr:hypothetical protein [Streptomyces sp. GS7]QHC24839.1 hypothetical protein GR130_29165 [Streptomyces sp. GS7]
MPRRTPLRFPFRAAAARPLLRRLALPLLLGGLLLAAVPCGAHTPHHHRTAGPVTAAPVAGTAADGGRSDDTDCPPDAAGRIPPARSAAAGRTAAAPGAAPGVLGTAVRSAAARRPAAAGRAARHGPPRGGRPTLAALCRCRI